MTARWLAASIFAILFGGIIFTTAMGWWETKSTKQPVKFSSGEAAGQYNPADIRGSYLFGDVSRLFEIPLADLKAAFQLPEGTDPAQYPVKSLESQFEGAPVQIGTDSVRVFVAFYKNLPFDLSAGSYLPDLAAEILIQNATLTPDRMAYLKTHTLPTRETTGQATRSPTLQEAPGNQITAQGSAIPAAKSTAQAAAGSGEHVQPERTITGRTTFQDLLSWGVTTAAIEQVIGGAMPDASLAIRDYYQSKGEEFSSAKTALQELVDALP